MTTRNVSEAKAQLSSLLVLVENGEEVIISRAGKPVAKLSAYKPSQEPRKPGRFKGMFTVADDFNEFGPELQEMFYGKQESEPDR
ncbi:MAG TPA: type II toxin-antitoxin system prevent-host-death family antitoxin [Fimbriimonadaceae bacterium]|jgi:prevent-host-death family protein